MTKNKTKVIALISAKGGSGKTILSATIGKVLSELGKRVLIVDADAATNGLSLFYLTQTLSHFEENGKNLFGLFDEKFLGSKKIFVPLSKNLFLLPATFKFKNTMEVGHDNFSIRIEQLLELNSKEDFFDFIIIDNQAGSEYYTEHVINRSVSDEVIIVSEYDPISAAGIERLKGFFNQDLTYDRTWVVLNKVLPEFGDASNSFLEISKYLPPQIWNADVVKSYSKKEIPINFKHGNTFTLSIIKLIKTLLGKSICEELNSWIKGKEDLIKAPILDEYTRVKSQLLKYEEGSRRKKIDLTRYSIVIVLIIFSSINSIFYFTRETSLDSFLIIDVLTTALPLIMAGLVIYFQMLKLRKDKSEDLYKYEKKALSERIQELELLKQSNVEEILEGKRQ